MSAPLEIDAFTLSGLSGWTHHIADTLGFHISENPPHWLHMALHFILVVAPLVALFGFLVFLAQIIKKAARNSLFSNEDRAELVLVRNLIVTCPPKLPSV